MADPIKIIVKCNTIEDTNGNQLPVGLLDNQEYVDGTSASAQSAVLDAANNRVVRIKCFDIASLGGNVIGFIQVGTDPTASSTNCIPLCSVGDMWDGVLSANHKIAAYNCKIYIQLI